MAAYLPWPWCLLSSFGTVGTPTLMTNAYSGLPFVFALDAFPPELFVAKR